MPASQPGDRDPAVAELVEKVSARMAGAATVQQISSLADQAAREARGNPMTLAQIRELFEVAIDRARQIESVSARLARLMSESDG